MTRQASTIWLSNKTLKCSLIDFRMIESNPAIEKDTNLLSVVYGGASGRVEKAATRTGVHICWTRPFVVVVAVMVPIP